MKGRKERRGKEEEKEDGGRKDYIVCQMCSKDKMRGDEVGGYAKVFFLKILSKLCTI